MRLLIVADSLEGGLGAAVASQSAFFEAAGWAVATFTDLPRSARSAVGMARAGSGLHALARRFRPDVTHCHGLRSFMAARAFARPFVTLHGSGPVPSDPRAYDALRRAGRRIVPRLAAGAFTATPDGDGWRFLPHASPRLASLAEQPWPEGPPTFLWLGRLDEPKQPEVFVQAMAAIADTGARGLVAGTGPRRDDVARAVRQLAAPVDLLGQRDDVAELLARCWAVALFSTHEALSFAVQEAMWTGRTAVGSDLPGLRWLGADTVADVRGAAAALRKLCDPERARGLGVAAAGAIRQKLRPDDPWPAVLAAYDQGR